MVNVSPSLTPRGLSAIEVEMMAGIGPGPGSVNPGGYVGATGVPASTSASAAASTATNSVCGPDRPRGMLPWNSVATASTPGSVDASKPVGSAPVGGSTR